MSDFINFVQYHNTVVHYLISLRDFQIQPIPKATKLALKYFGFLSSLRTNVGFRSKEW